MALLHGGPHAQRATAQSHAMPWAWACSKASQQNRVPQSSHHILPMYVCTMYVSHPINALA
ncbi:hypothetical protein K504DRAFT_464826 [Pleomassaria siparia CBS 279.74]|uniref:Uncharacterized protein n=1 Tax=Pleomassaria siparia CBS 279.74 TaxID=1314801 RepID=A0A6G1KIU8_9PLEO|nr:hypothetical protein K504DRAFT_464826 [Pleomassaria siparia CBS 279.74]